MSAEVAGIQMTTLAEDLGVVVANSKTASRRAVIVGAGIAGLATALRLHRAGWDTLVIERAQTRRSSGYMVNLLGQGYDAAEHLGVLEALKPSDIGWFTSILVRPDGSEKLTVPVAIAQAALGDRALTVFRGDLESVLYEAVSSTVTIRFGTTVRAVSQDSGGVDIALSDGTSERADLLIGADGLHSSVREMVFGPDSEFRVDLEHMVGAFPLFRVPEVVPNGAGATFIGVRRTAAVVNLGPERSSAFFTYRTDDPDAELKLGPLRALTASFGDLHGGVPEALRQLETDPEAAYFDAVSQIVMDRWSTGRVVLVGDAAWCVTPFAGYGAALALVGADQLGDALEGDTDISTALGEWEALLRPEVRKRQALARRGASQYAPPSKFHIWMSDLMLRAIQIPGIRGIVRRSIQRANK